jgi:hypothetical protein
MIQRRAVCLWVLQRKRIPNRSVFCSVHWQLRERGTPPRVSPSAECAVRRNMLGKENIIGVLHGIPHVSIHWLATHLSVPHRTPSRTLYFEGLSVRTVTSKLSTSNLETRGRDWNTAIGMYKGWATKTGPCTSTFEDLLCFDCHWLVARTHTHTHRAFLGTSQTLRRLNLPIMKWAIQETHIYGHMWIHTVRWTRLFHFDYRLTCSVA